MTTADHHAPDVDRDVVLRVLKMNGVSVTLVVHDGMDLYIMRKSEVLEAQPLRDRVGRHILGRLANKFDFSMGEFFS